MSKYSGNSSYLGRHTTLSYVIKRRELWRRIPYLKENEGRAPPVVLAVGDRRRVHVIAHRLRKPVLIPETSAKLSSQHVSEKDLSAVREYGRVAMAIGLASSIPVLVVETQMGAPATQIIMNEVLSDELTSADYQVGKARINLRRKLVIRVGTAGGINCNRLSPVSIGDLVNATHSIGMTGAVMQSLHRLDFWRPGGAEEFGDRWKRLGSNFTVTGEGDPRVECNQDVVEALDMAGQRFAKGRYHKGGNVTKDSLYGELNIGMFLELCRTQNCRSTEMEFSAIAVAAREHNAHFGMISAIVGLMPGTSFAGSETIKAAAEQRSIRVALEAVRKLVGR